MKSTLLLSLLFAGTCAMAQTAKDSATNFVYVGIGYQYQAFNQLTNRIGTRPEYVKPGTSYASVMVGINKEMNHLMEDVNLKFATSNKGDDEKRGSSIMNFGTTITLGYNFSKKANFRFYPFAGISGEVYRAQFNKDVSAVPFDSILISNGAQQRVEPVVFTNTFFCYQGGIALDFISSKNRILHSIGLKASYTGSFKNRSWRVNENQLIASAPVDKVSQFNVALILGVGRRLLNRM